MIVSPITMTLVSPFFIISGGYPDHDPIPKSPHSVPDIAPTGQYPSIGTSLGRAMLPAATERG